MIKSKEIQASKYEAPAIIYEGKVSTRAGNVRSSEDGSGAVDLFNDDSDK